MSYYIREWIEEDIYRLTELEKLCFPDPWSYDMFKAEFDNPLTKYYVAELSKEDSADEDGSGDVIAYIGFLTVAGECQINNVAVHPDYRKQEIASELMELVINETEDNGVTFCTLEVRVGNAAALKLYERFGFKQVGLRPYYYEDGAGAVLMTREMADQIDDSDISEAEF